MGLDTRAHFGVVFLLTITASMAFVPFSQNSFGATGNFEYHQRELFQQPTICIFQPGDVRVDENRWKRWFADSKTAIDEWENILKQGETSASGKWNIKVVEIPLDRQHQYNSDGCNIEVHFTILPSEYGVLGWYYPGTGIIEIVTTQSEYCGKKYFPEYGLTFQIYCYKDTLERSKKMAAVLKHELGHAFGLGHYVTTDPDLLESWQNNPLGQPSIMTFAHHNEDQMRIQGIDVIKLQETQGGSGFGKTKNTNPVFEQEFIPKVPYVFEKINPTSERVGGVTLSVLIDGRNFGKTATLNEGQRIQLSGQVTDRYGNGMPNQYVAISQISIPEQVVTDSNGNFLTSSWVAKHNQDNMGTKRSTWNPTAFVLITGGEVSSEPLNLFVEILGTPSTPKTPIFQGPTKSTPKITLFPVWNSVSYVSSLLVNENKKIQLLGTVTDEFERGKYYAQVTIYEKSNPAKFRITTDTNRDGMFSVDWLTEHNAMNYANGESMWDLIAKTEIKNRIIESNIAEIKITDSIVNPLEPCGINKFLMDGICVTISDLTPSSSTTAEHIRKVLVERKIQSLRDSFVHTTIGIEEGVETSEKSLTGLIFKNKEAQEKINFAWNLLKDSKKRVDAFDNHLKNIDEASKSNHLTNVGKNVDSGIKSARQAGENLVKISELIEEAKQLEKQEPKFCFLWWCW